MQSIDGICLYKAEERTLEITLYPCLGEETLCESRFSELEGGLLREDSKHHHSEHQFITIKLINCPESVV